MMRPILLLLLTLFITAPLHADDTPLPKDDGYRGIWYQIKDPTGFPKYSGGFATYPQQIRPTAIYCKAVNKTFFVYGGRPKDKNDLLHMVSYYDHATGTFPRPTILLDKNTSDAHDNPALAIDSDGYLWIFSNTHGPAKRSSIHRSTKPYSIDSFEEIAPNLSLSYCDPWFFPGQGFILLQNRYTDGRAVAFQTSPDGRTWSKPSLIAQMKVGHYAISVPSPDHTKFGVAFNYHPHGLDSRTNLYFLETTIPQSPPTAVGGSLPTPTLAQSWHTASGKTLDTPLHDPHTPALIHDYEAEHLLVYLKDVRYDQDNHPVILYLTSHGFTAGPKNGPYTWYTARWTGTEWAIHPVTTSDHNYDFGEMQIAPDGSWRLMAPTDPGPTPFMTGGEVVLWTTTDQGVTWTRVRNVTDHSPLNNTFVRIPENAQDDFYAYWADGDPTKLSDCHLYFTNREGTHVWRLPTTMTTDTAKPEQIR
jgi:hypothetical protein